MTNVKGQNSILNGVPTVLWDDCISLWNEENQNKKQNVRHKYHLGLLIQKVDKLHITSRERKEIITKIKEFLGVKDKRIINRVRRLVSIFTEREIEKLIAVGSNGYCIGWGHFDVVLVDYLDKEQMISYLNYAQENKVRNDKLYTKIMLENNRDKDPQGRKKPKNVKQFVSSTQKYLLACQETDNLLLSVHPKTLQAWMKNVEIKTKQSMLSQLDQHIVMCNRLREKLA